MQFVLALIAAGAALVSYRYLEEWTGRSWLPASLRAAGWGCLALLLFNASCPARRVAERPTVLLDGSLSMQAAGGRWAEALVLARSLGTVRLVGPPPGDTTPSAGSSRISAAVAAAASAGRPAILVTDGEVEDGEDIAADSLSSLGIRLLPRQALPDLALTRVEGTTRLTSGDSLRVEVEVTGFGAGAGRRLNLEAGEGARVWLRGSVTLDSSGRASTVLQGPLPAVPPGPHVLRVALTNAADSEPRDDARLLVVTVVPTPGVVLLASPPSWESKFLLETLQATTALPVRGYLETERGVWRRAAGLRIVPSGEVSDAARRADLLVMLGPGAQALGRGTRARGRWQWPGAERGGLGGDWYISTTSSSPVSGAWLGLAIDSFPPGTAVTEIRPEPGGWIGLTAQAGRRGAVRPVLVGRDSARVRSLLTGVDGLWRWAFRGGSSEQGYRALVASAAAWLLGGGDSLTGMARIQHDVVQRGRPLIFEWSGGGSPSAVPIELSGPASARDTLVFDGSGHAELLLSPGVWHYRLGGGGGGTVAVEPYSEEWLPRRVTLHDRGGAPAPAPNRRPLRTALSLFGLTVAAFAGEWLARRRMGLR